MTLTVNQKRQIAESLKAASKLQGFDGVKVWLTYCITGSPERLNNITLKLKNINPYYGEDAHEDAFGGFIYPAIPVAHDVAAVVANIEHLIELCDQCECEICDLDLDFGESGDRKNFKCLGPIISADNLDREI